MKKFILIALLGLLFVGAPTMIFAQGEDSTEVSLDEPKDTISIDNMDPKFYEEEAPAEKSNTATYAIVAAVVVIGGGAAWYFMKGKKK
ncbi:MAG: CD1107 family mobile element protein [Candidatus Saccharibacteria bacterium]